MSNVSAIHGASNASSLYGQIASGNRLNRAANGASELAITQKQSAQITGYDVGTRNMKTGQAMLNISDAALDGITDYLQRMRELAIGASNTALLTDSDRQSIQTEVDQLKKGIEGIATQTQFNTMNLLDGSHTQGFEIASDGDGSSVTVNHNVNATLRALGIDNFDVTGNFDIKTIDDALEKVTKSRVELGAQTNRLDHSIRNNGIASYNTMNAMSQMGDTDYPKAISQLKQQQTLETFSIMLQRNAMQNEERRMQNFFTMH